MNLRRAHVYVSGRVQGVCYRDTVRMTAEKVEATGWVRNLSDGRVEAVIEGSQDAVDKLLTFMEIGPSRAYVENLEIREESYQGEFVDFQVRYNY